MITHEGLESYHQLKSKDKHHKHKFLPETAINDRV